MKKYIVEFIGTFFLVLTIGFSVASGSSLAPLAIGAGLIAIVYGGGHISGAHYNPAMTLALWLRGRCPTGDVLPYFVAQFSAAALAALLVVAIEGKPLLGPGSFAVGPSLVVEFLFTFALAWVILNVATAKGTAGNSFYGAAIGLIVVAGAIAVGKISGGAFNPAVGLALPILGLAPLSQLPVYFGACFFWRRSGGLCF